MARRNRTSRPESDVRRGRAARFAGLRAAGLRAGGRVAADVRDVARVVAVRAGAFFAVALVAVVFFAAAFFTGALLALDALAEVAFAGARPDAVRWVLVADARLRDGWSAREREGAAGREAMMASVPTNTFSTVRHTRHTSSCREEFSSCRSSLHDDRHDHRLAPVRGTHPLADRPPHPLLQLVGVDDALGE